jgi:hypothetical protein
VKNTKWELLTLQEIERIEQRLEKGKFVKGDTYTLFENLSEKKRRDWITYITVYSSGEESVTISKYDISYFGHLIYPHDRGDVVIRVSDKNYREILRGLPASA